MDFTVAAITNPGKKDRLIEVINEELIKIREEGITETELKEAKAAYPVSRVSGRSDDGALNQELLSSLFNERTLQHVADHEQNISDATLEAVNAAIRKYIDPERLVISVAETSLKLSNLNDWSEGSSGRVMTTRVPWMAPQDSFDPSIHARDGSILTDRINGILTTSRCVTA